MKSKAIKVIYWMIAIVVLSVLVFSEVFGGKCLLY